MRQLLMFPDARPLVERLGAEFFRNAPACAGVYLMRDVAGNVVYVGKAKNLRKRLASYRVANPERGPLRRLRLLGAVRRIDFEQCGDERSALSREATLIRELRPRFNRAGTWQPPRKHLLWRVVREHGPSPALELKVALTPEVGWQIEPNAPSGTGWIKCPVARLAWRAAHPDQGSERMPAGWSKRTFKSDALIWFPEGNVAALKELEPALRKYLEGEPDLLWRWCRDRVSRPKASVDQALLQMDLEELKFPLAQPEADSAVSATPALNQGTRAGSDHEPAGGLP